MSENGITKRSISVGAVVLVLLGSGAGFGLNCVNNALDAKVDKELYLRDRVSADNDRKNITVKLERMESEINKQGRIQAAMAAAQGIKVER